MVPKRNRLLFTVWMAGFCGVLAGCSAVESLPMAGAPYCDSEIRNGGFRSGMELRIAGETYSDVVGIDSPGSLVYDLGGLAEAFTAEAAINPETCRDEIRLDIIVDRNLKQSLHFTRETPVRRISVPLTGSQQLELSVQFGSEYRSRTLFFTDARFLVRDRAAFLEHLSRCRDRAEMARDLPPEPLPSLPTWKAVRIEPFVWRDHPAFRIENGVLEYEIVPSFGGRLVGFRRVGGKNILEQPRQPLPEDLRRGRSYYRQHTRFARSEPAWYFLPGEDLHLFGPYELRFGEEGECILTSRPSLYLMLETEYRFRLRPGADRLEVTTTFRNLGKFSRPCGIWSVAVLPTESIATLELPASRVVVDAPAETARLWRDRGEFSLLDIAKIPSGLSQSVERRSSNPRQYIRARLITGEIFSIEVPPASRRAKFPSHVYSTDPFTELEFHSETKELKENEEISMQEIWTLRMPN